MRSGGPSSSNGRADKARLNKLFKSSSASYTIGNLSMASSGSSELRIVLGLVKKSASLMWGMDSRLVGDAGGEASASMPSSLQLEDQSESLSVSIFFPVNAEYIPLLNE